jgi:signal transduction histidine kinase
MSAHRSMQLLARQQPLQLQDFVSLVGGSSRQLQFSQTLLQTTLENIPQGISVVDADLRLVAWNQRYQALFRYPQRLLYVGCRIETIYHFNAMRGVLELGGEAPEAAVQKRLQHLRSGQPYRLERYLPGGVVVEIRGTPLANGGYVTTYTDISDHHAMLAQLQEARQTLEARVAQRTAELTELNERLQRENSLRARIEQELQEVHASKSRFLAAASHDLLQPINAARLFVASVSERLRDPASLPAAPWVAGLKQDVSYLDSALGSAEQLISTLREISRLSAGREQIQRQHFNISQLLQPLAQEAQVLAQTVGLQFRWVDASVWVCSDPHMLRRVIQNFISNALRYTSQGKVLLGCRRRGQQLVIEVWDTGPGIAPEYQQRIFEEFERLPGASAGHEGLGLGLSIVQRIGQLLGHPVGVTSTPGRGSVFRITVPLGEVQAAPQLPPPTPVRDPQLLGVPVLCIDNEEVIQAGMRALLEQWGCQVETAANLGQSLRRWTRAEPPALVLADYHLDRETGLDVLEALRYHWQQPLQAIVISADNAEAVRARVAQAGYHFLAKPVQPHALRQLMRKLLRG